MIEVIEDKLTEYKSILDKIAGGHSFAIVEFGFYEEMKIERMFGEGNYEKPITDFFSKITWLEYSEAFRKG